MHDGSGIGHRDRAGRDGCGDLALRAAEDRVGHDPEVAPEGAEADGDGEEQGLHDVHALERVGRVVLPCEDVAHRPAEQRGQRGVALVDRGRERSALPEELGAHRTPLAPVTREHPGRATAVRGGGGGGSGDQVTARDGTQRGDRVLVVGPAHARAVPELGATRGQEVRHLVERRGGVALDPVGEPSGRTGQRGRRRGGEQERQARALGTGGGLVGRQRCRCPSSTTWALVPLMPNDDTPARRGRAPRGQSRAEASSSRPERDQSMSGLGVSACRVRGSVSCWRASTILITRARPPRPGCGRRWT